ncbi:dachshund homolog 1-like [Salvia splendens]|uniref:dachshund homolog 1-like n=1 Tax=Salvia splendens TaxID=180675 RepID=UPI001C27EA99|nr:dachshund homolog 1-like [Salvia splendens]
MHVGVYESPATDESGYDGYPSQPWGWSQTPPPWGSSPTHPPSQPWRSSPTPHPFQRNLSRSAFGDYRPNLDALNHPLPETPFHSSQSPSTDADRDALETMMGLLSPDVLDTPAARVDTPIPTRVGGSGGAGGSSGGGGRGGSRGGSGAGSGGGG